MSFEARAVIPGDHPALAGHFPGNPVVPGVLVLEIVADMVQRWREGSRVREIRSARFLAPVAPGRELVVRLRERDRSRIAFECVQDGRTAAAGELVVERVLDAGGEGA